MSRKTLNADNLATLGPDRLAILLIEVSQGSAEIKRRLRLELAHAAGPQELARDVRKRLASLRTSRTFVSWRKRPALVRDLATLSEMITGRIAAEDACLAHTLTWEFLDIAPSVFRRVDDSRGEVAAVFLAARDRLADIAPRAAPDPQTLADRVWAAIETDADNLYHGIIAVLAPTLGEDGLAHLAALARQHAARPVASDDDSHAAIRFLRDLRSDGGDHRTEQRARLVRATLRQIAEARGDTDGYIAQLGAQDLARPAVAADAAQRLLEVGRPQEALDLLASTDAGPADDGWHGAHVAALIALGQGAAAQAHLWDRFARTLHAASLRDHLKALPDFDDVEAEDRARDHALHFPDAMAALAFFLEWPDLPAAARLVEGRRSELDGDRYDLLGPAAEALRLRHPLAAVLCLRAMIDFALRHGRAARYGHAADHLMDCAALDGDISDYGAVPTHLRYVDDLRARHARKAAFWARVD